MKRKKSIMKIAATMFALAFATVMSLAGSVGVFAKEETFTDGGYIYKGTGYTTTEWTGNTELVAKIDTYYYQNLRDEEFAGADVYFYKRDAAGNRMNAEVYGYGYTTFEKNGTVYTKSKVEYGHNNVEPETETGCSMWNLATPHYYGNALRDY